MSAPAECYYEPLVPGLDSEGRFRSTAATSGPWSPHAQHGGPPAALLGRALELLEEAAPRVIGRAQGWAFPQATWAEDEAPAGLGVRL